MYVNNTGLPIVLRLTSHIWVVCVGVCARARMCVELLYFSLARILHVIAIIDVLTTSAMFLHLQVMLL